MPHVTLLYPFRPRNEFPALQSLLARACASVPAFSLRLAEFRCFCHGSGRCTLWLAPEPKQAIIHLQSVLAQVVPDCNDVAGIAGGFMPHLSVGQAANMTEAEQLCRALQTRWQPLSFAVREVCLIWRNEPPDDVFRIACRLPLG